MKITKREGNIRKDKGKRWLMLFMAISMLLGSISGAIIFPSKTYATNNHKKYSLGKFNDFGFSYKNETQLNEAISQMGQHLIKLEEIEGKLKEVESTSKRYDENLNLMMEYEIHRIQLLTLSKSIEKQSNPNFIRDIRLDNEDSIFEVLISEDDAENVIQKSVDLLKSTPDSAIQSTYNGYISEFSECRDGLTECGETTHDMEPKLITWDSLKVAHPDSDVTEEDVTETALKSLEPLKQLGLASTDMTWVSSLDEADLEKWIEDNADNAVERLQILQLLGEVYKTFGLESEVTNNTGLNAKIKDNYDKIKELAKAADVSLENTLDNDIEGFETTEEDVSSESDEITTGADGENSIADLVDIEKQDLSESFKSLIAWSSSFVPFKTNVGESNLTDALTKEEEEIYRFYSKNKVQIFSAGGKSNVAKGLQSGSYTEIHPITLGDFLDNVQDEEMVLFLETPNTAEPEADATLDTETGEATVNEEESNEDVTEEVAVESGRGTTKNPARLDGTPARLEDPYPKLMGPIYASSGKSYKEIYGLDIAGEQSKEALFGGISQLSPDFETGEGLSDSSLIKESVISKLKGQTMNMNYMLMHNILEEGYHLNDDIEADLNYPIFSDFMGNIITRSGFVVVPAAANYTYFNYPDKLPMFNSMFLRGYPKIEQDAFGGYKNTSRTEYGKLVYQRASNGGIEIGSFNQNGRKIKKEFDALPLWSNIPILGVDGGIEFMNDITGFVEATSMFYSNKENPGGESNYVFVNPGVKVRDKSKRYMKFNNLKNIPENPKSVEWRLLKDINMIFMSKSEEKMLDSYVFSGIASVVTDTKTTDPIKMEDYQTRGEEFKENNAILTKIGQMYENLLKLQIFEGNSLSGVTLGIGGFSGEYPYLIISIFMILLVVSAIVLALRGGVALLGGDFKEIKTLVFSIAAIGVIGIFTIYVTPTTIDFLFNKPVDLILKQESPMAVLSQVEDVGVGNNYFFTGGREKDVNPEGESTLTLEKLSQNSVLELRRQMGEESTLSDAFYFPSLDKSKVNIIGDKVYLQGMELKIDTKDLMNSINISELNYKGVMTDRLSFNIEELSEVSYYTPFFNIAESLTDTINRYSSLAENSYTLKTYPNGETKSMGRADEYFKSLVFIAPEEIESEIENRMEQVYGSQKSGENLVREDMYDLFKTFIEGGDIEEEDLTELGGNEDEEVLEEGETSTEEEENVRDDVTEELEEELGESLGTEDEFLKDKNFLEGLIDWARGETDDPEGDELNLGKLESSLMGTDVHASNDWLGLRKVLLAVKDPTLFPEDRYMNITETKWYPESFKEFGYTKELDRKIVNVNEETKKFVLNKLVPISKDVSDENLIKIVSLYATMRFNEEFSEKEAIYPRSIDIGGIPDEYIVSSMLMPKAISYKNPSKAVTEYIAEKDGFVGITVTFLDRIADIARKVIKEVIVFGITILSPFILVYIYAYTKERKGNYLKGLIITLAAVTSMNLIEIGSFMWLTNLANSGGGNALYYFIIMIRMVMTYLHFKLLFMWVGDIKNGGYLNYVDATSNVMANITGMDYNTATQYAMQGGSYEGSYGEDYSDYGGSDYTYSDYVDDFTLDEDYADYYEE